MIEQNELEREAEYYHALVAEIRLLVRAVVSDPNQRISNLSVEWTNGAETKQLTYPAVVSAMSEALPTSSTTDGIAQTQASIGKLQAIRDALIGMTKPATGLSIAYTALVAGNDRPSGNSSYRLATVAFGGLEQTAKHHKFLINSLVMAAILLSFFAAWEATKASLGKALLQVLDPLRTQQALIFSDKFKLEVELDKSAGSNGAADFKFRVPICDRAKLYKPEDTIANTTKPMNTENTLKPKNDEADKYDRTHLQNVSLDETAEIREVCGRDKILQSNFRLAHKDLCIYMHYWPDLIGGPYSTFSHVYDSTTSWLLSLPNGRPTKTWALATSALEAQCAQNPSPVASVNDRDDDVEFRVAPIVQVISSYVLPLTFGVIGSILYVILQHYRNIISNSLLPRDFPLDTLRVVLGVVVAASISLLITGFAGPITPLVAPPSGSTAPSSLASSLPLSASLITFLAGFGAEAVFEFLRILVQRVFASPGNSKTS